MSKEKVKKEPVKTTVATLQEAINAGKTKEDIGKELGLNKAQTDKLFKAAKEKGLKIVIKRAKRVVAPAFVLLTDENEVPVEDSTKEEAKPIKPKKLKESKETSTFNSFSDDEELINSTTEQATIEDLPPTEESKDTQDDW